jgi:hypothetical protein
VVGLGAGLPSLGLEKAQLVVVQGDPDVTSLEFKYNPESFSFSQTAIWTDPPHHVGKKYAPPPTHQRTNPATVSMEVFFDAFEEFRGDVTEDVLTLVDWTKPCPPMMEGGVMNPPLLSFMWGSSKALEGFLGYLSSVAVNYTLFRMDGTPIRATCTISLIEVPDPPARTNPTSGGQAGLHAHVLIEGETLQSVAWAEYRRPDFWRALAAFNGIDDPFRVPPGTRLLLPPHREASVLSKVGP